MDKDQSIDLQNSKLKIISQEDRTPIPPPRKHKKGLREKFESVAKTSLQALQIKKPVDEPPVIKKTWNYSCPCDDPNHEHNRNRKKIKPDSVSKASSKNIEKGDKRKKNLSVISLPNYNDLKLSFLKTDKELNRRYSDNSALSLSSESKKNSVGKKDYITRCRSFGSILPSQLSEKAKAPKATIDIESDDSFGALEDWDCRILEHYNPKDSSLPRPKKVKTEKEIINDIEGMIVPEEEEMVKPPKPPARRSESLIRRLVKSVSESDRKSIDGKKKKQGTKDGAGKVANVTPPPSPASEVLEKEAVKIKASDLPTIDENGKVEHSSLMKILELYRTGEREKAVMLEEETFPYIDDSVKSETESLIDAVEHFEEKIYENEYSAKKEAQAVSNNLNNKVWHPVEDFLRAERVVY